MDWEGKRGRMDEKIKRRWPGQPVKKVPRGKKRIQVSMILSAEIKTRIDNEAKRSGRTFSQTGEMLIERALAVDNVLQLTNQTLEELFEAAMLRHGYRKLRVRPHPKYPRGFVWVSPEMHQRDEGKQPPGEVVDIQIEEEPK